MLELLAREAIGPLVGVLVAWIIGNRISATWNERQKRREKEWNWYLRSLDPSGVRRDVHAAFVARASRAEGVMEAVLLKVASERKLTHWQACALGKLRQAYQVLRESIADGEPISYGSHDDAKYMAFKRLATFLGNLLVSRAGNIPDAQDAFHSFVEITHNRHEMGWSDTGCLTTEMTASSGDPSLVSGRVSV